MRIPFCPISPKKAKSLLGNSFYGVVEPIRKISSSLELQLEQADFDISARDYLSLALFSAIFMFIIMDIVFILITFRFVGLERALSTGLLVGGLFFLITFFYIKSYPKLLVKKKVYNIERNLLYALRHMQVQVTSGVTLFDALMSVSQGNYGRISQEFKAAVKSINTGVPIDTALDELTLRNPSTYFRRTMWQISNGVKSGGDIGGILKNTIDYISAEQKIMIRRYGAQLNPLTVSYMMIAVIIPSLGVTFLMVVSSFAKIPVTENTFWVIVAFVSLFQFMFMGMLKSKRPNLL